MRVLLFLALLIQQATALHTLPRTSAADPSITQAPSPAAVDLRFRALNPTATLNIQTCASKCFNAIVTKSTLCILGDWECECSETNANIIQIGAMECVYASCGYMVGAAVWSEAADFCTSVRNGDFDLPSSTSALEAPSETTTDAGGLSTDLPYYLPTTTAPKASRTSATAPASINTAGSSSSGSGMSTGELAGTIAGVVGAFAGVVSAWFGYKMYKKRNEGRAEEQRQMLGGGYGMTSSSVPNVPYNHDVGGQYHTGSGHGQWFR